ncbi:MAG TPA: protein BatD, partial [Phaeodactylibacter sp.]|nr:protein BatD [Phaeodactylibacter sp.]
MTYQKWASIAILFFFLLPSWSIGQATLTATPDVKRITQNEYFTVTFTLTNGSWTQFTPPDFRGFNQVGNPAQQSSTSIINGKVTRSQSLVYNVLTKKKGKFVIGPATAVVNGKKIKSNSFTIEVVEGKAKTDESVETGDEFFVRAEPSTRTARIGQQITLDYKLYTKINIESYDLGEDPEYKGFFAEDIRQVNYRTMREEINGEMYTTKIFKRVALYPQQAGLLTIEPLDLRLGVSTQPSGRRRSFFFNDVKYKPYRVDSVQIHVLPFPQNSIPESFSGAVGRYQMMANVNKTNITTDDALTVTMTIQGNGDIKRIKLPDLGLGENFEVYEPEILEEKTFEYQGEVLGKKVLEYQALPLEPGDYTVQPRFTYFDTDSSRFITLGIEPVKIVVKKGRKKRKSNIVQRAETDKLVFLPNKTQTSWTKKGTFFFGSSLFWILMGLPFLFLGGAVIYRQQLKKKGTIDLTILKSQRAQKVAVQKLSKAEEFMKKQNSRGFYDEISKAMFGYVCDKLNIPLSELTKAN